jgi:hypothetical protein
LGWELGDIWGGIILFAYELTGQIGYDNLDRMGGVDF